MSSGVNDSSRWPSGEYEAEDIIPAFLRILTQSKNKQTINLSINLSSHNSTSSKDAVRNFAAWYFKLNPELSHEQAMMLFFGSNDPSGKELVGLVDLCGQTKLSITGSINQLAKVSAQSINQSINQLSTTARLSFQLVEMLVDPAVNLANNQSLFDCLMSDQLTIKKLHNMKFGAHYHQSINPNDRETVFKLIVLIEEGKPDYQSIKNEWIESAECISEYDKWLTQRMAEAAETTKQSTSQSIDSPDRTIVVWSDNLIEDCDAIDALTSSAISQLITEDPIDQVTGSSGKHALVDPLGIIKARQLAQNQTLNQSNKQGKTASKKMKTLWKKMKPTTKSNLPSSQLNNATQTLSAGQATDQSVDQADLLCSVITRGSISIEADDFNPLRFLSEVHAETSIDQLMTGLTHLNKSIKSRSEALQSLIVDHFDAYVQSIDTIDHIHELIESELVDNSSRSLKLNQSIDQLHVKAQSMYHSIVSQHEQTERIKSTIQSLKRHEQLIKAPAELRNRSVNQPTSQSNYSMLVREVKRIRNMKLNQPTNQPNNQQSEGSVLQAQLLAECNRSISQICSELFSQLNGSSRPISQQMKIVNLLIDLQEASSSSTQLVNQPAAQSINPFEYFVTCRIQSVMRDMSNVVLKQIDRLVDRLIGSAQPFNLDISQSNPPMSPMSPINHSVNQSSAPNSPSSVSQLPSVFYTSDAGAVMIKQTIKKLHTLMTRVMPDFQSMALAQSAKQSTNQLFLKQSVFYLFHHVSALIRILLFEPNNAHTYVQSINQPNSLSNNQSSIQPINLSSTQLPLLSPPDSIEHLSPKMFDAIQSILRIYQSIRDTKLGSHSVNQTINLSNSPASSDPITLLSPLLNLRVDSSRWLIDSKVRQAEMEILQLTYQSNNQSISSSSSHSIRELLQHHFRSNNQSVEQSSQQCPRFSMFSIMVYSINQSLINCLFGLPGARSTWLIRMIIPRLVDCLKVTADACHAHLRWCQRSIDQVNNQSNNQILHALYSIAADIHVIHHSALPLLKEQLNQSINQSSVQSIINETIDQSIHPLFVALEAMWIDTWTRYAAQQCEQHIQSINSSYRQNKKQSSRQSDQSISQTISRLNPRPAALLVVHALIIQHANVFASIPGLIDRCMTSLKPVLIASLVAKHQSMTLSRNQSFDDCLIDWFEFEYIISCFDSFDNLIDHSNVQVAYDEAVCVFEDSLLASINQTIDDPQSKQSIDIITQSIKNRLISVHKQYRLNEFALHAHDGNMTMSAREKEDDD